MNIALTYEICKYVIGFLLSAIPSVITIIATIKNCKKAKVAAEKEKARNYLIQQAKILVNNAEKMYKGIDAALKQQGESAGTLKKESVMDKLKAIAIDKGYEFDDEFYSNEIEEIVKLTKEVNSK